MTVHTHRLDIVAHKTSGWLIATAEGLPGFFVQGATIDQILERAPHVLDRYLKGRKIKAENIQVVQKGPQSPGIEISS